MADGKVKRGEVYWIGKIGYATLGAVVSSSGDNEKNEFVCGATICGEEPHRGVATEVTGRLSYVACNNLRTLPKRELRTLVGELSSSEMAKIDDQLEKYFDLGYEDEEKERELISLRDRVKQYETKVASLEEGILSRSHDMNMWREKYNAALDRIVEMELDRDIARKIAEKEKPVEKTEETPAPVEFQRKKVNVNTASGKEIIESLGVSKVIAYSITGYRNKNGRFVEVEELLEVAKITKPIFERIKDYIEIAPVEESANDAPVEESAPKVNINTASARKLMAVGFSKEVASRIVHSRKMRGPFNAVDDLERVDGISAGDIRKLRDLLEV